MTAEAERVEAANFRRSFLIQLVVAGLATTAMHATRPTMTYRALALGASPLEIGLIQSAFSILPALTAVAIGRYIDRVGESRYLMLSLLTLAVGSLFATLAGGLLPLALAQVALGFGQIIYLVASQSLIANHGPRAGREGRYGHYSTVNSLGQLAGPAIAAAIVGSALATIALVTSGQLASADPPSLAAVSAPVAAAGGFLEENPEGRVFLLAGILALVACGLASRIPGYPRRPVDPATGAEPGLLRLAGQVLRRQGMISAMSVSIAVISAVDVLIAYLPAYGEEAGLSVALVGILLSVRAASSLVSRLFMTQLITLLGRSRLLALSMVMAGGGIAVMPFVAEPAVLIAIMVVVGLGLGLGQPMTIAWVANRSPRRERATALGVRLTGNRVALLVVPTLMGAIAGTAGITAIFIVVAVSLGAGAVVAIATEFDGPGEPVAAVPAEPEV
jgi:MFS family permease